LDDGHDDAATAVLPETLGSTPDQEWLDRLRAEIAIGEAQIARGEIVAWTPDFMERLMREADERTRLGLPVRDVVKP
jgi:hypothetical protein